MKKLLMALSAALMLTGCAKDYDPAMDDEPIVMDAQQTITFRVTSCEWVMTRASMEDAALTDLWVFDYSGGRLAGQTHQSAGDDNFGRVSLTMDNGTHTVYFVASRGDSPTVDTDAKTVTWATPRDTFWGSITLNASTAGATQSVELSRVATRLKITVTDAVPANAASLVFTPDTWYYGIDYTSGDATSDDDRPRSVTIPASYAGTTDKLSVTIWGLSGQSEWTTGFLVKATDEDGETINEVSIADAPFSKNRTTAYSGKLFTQAAMATLSVNDTWQSDVVMTW